MARMRKKLDPREARRQQEVQSLQSQISHFRKKLRGRQRSGGPDYKTLLADAVAKLTELQARMKSTAA